MHYGKVVINLTTGHEDADKVTVPFLVATAAQAKGNSVAIFSPRRRCGSACRGHAEHIESAGAPPVDNARVAGATPLWELDR